MAKVLKNQLRTLKNQSKTAQPANQYVSKNNTKERLKKQPSGQGPKT